MSSTNKLALLAILEAIEKINDLHLIYPHGKNLKMMKKLLTLAL
jgi:hypothetical protein